MPWVFTQAHPLETRTFIDEAKQRGFDLDLTTLRELYRHGLLVPFVEVTYRPVREPANPTVRNLSRAAPDSWISGKPAIPAACATSRPSRSSGIYSSSATG